MQYDKLNKSQIIDTLTFKGINHDSKADKNTLLALLMGNSKKLAMGNRTGKYFYGSKKNTHAGNVCKLIAMGIIKSKSDIRKHYTKKYTFNETLSRLAYEGIITFTDSKKSAFELTSTGNDLANMYKSQGI